MRKFLFSVGLLSFLLVGGCSEEAVPASENEEASATETEKAGATESAVEVVPDEVAAMETEPVDEPKIEEAIAMSDSGSSDVDSKAEARDYYLTVTKAEMDAINQEMNEIWQTYLVEPLEEPFSSSDWSTDFMNSLHILALEYQNMIDPINQIPFSGLGGYTERVNDFQLAIIDSIIARLDASMVLIEAIETTDGIYIDSDVYNVHLDDALGFQVEALKHQEGLEKELGVTE